MAQSVHATEYHEYDPNVVNSYMLDVIAYLTDRRQAAAQAALNIRRGRSEAAYREKWNIAKWHIERIDYVLDALKLWWT